MKKVFAALLVAFLLPVFAHAVSSGLIYNKSITITAKTFATSGSTPVTYTPTTIVGPGVEVFEVVIRPDQTTTAEAFTLWDAPNGLTQSAGAYVVASAALIAGAAPGPDCKILVDFKVACGPNGMVEGRVFKWYPTLLATGGGTTDFCGAKILYRKAGVNKTQGTYGQ